MTARLVWLGKLADIAGAAESELELGAPIGWDMLLCSLPAALAAALRDERIRAARNGALLPDKAALEIVPGDEIAFLPPVSGG
ncbi:MoaD/ThiS family protein [Parablastomonas sp. CN1-191]|uniref:MoaD/ThiS family protein n=1 Tax=Parablastomonas sp. CN1-191 TaxID=3400908 RepID=UPI003BF83D0D